MGLIFRFQQHIQNLPERELARLKVKQEALIVKQQQEKTIAVAADAIAATEPEAKIAARDFPKVKVSISDWTMFGSLNKARFYEEMGHGRRFSHSEGLNRLASAFASVAAIPVLVLKVAFSALLVFKDTDPLLRNSLDLVYAVKQTFFGTLSGVAKLAISPFTDIYQCYKEYSDRSAYPGGHTALLLIDIQNSFLPAERDLKEEDAQGRGELAVQEGDTIIVNANRLINRMKVVGNLVIGSLDFHGIKHKSFGPNSDKPPFTQATIPGVEGPQMLWSAHCVQDTEGAEFAEDLQSGLIDFVVKKGFDDLVDSYGAFFDNGKVHKTKLDEYLKMNNVKKLVVAGLATDYCVRYTAEQARDLGYTTYLVTDASRGIFMPRDDGQNPKEVFFNKAETDGIKLVKTQQVLDNINQLAAIEEFSQLGDIQ